MMLENSLAADPNRHLKSIYVWEAPVRLWHWVMTLSILVLIPTGLLISYPPPSLHGEASDHFLLGYIRFAGHNPMAQFAMFFMLTLTSLFMIATGFALYSEGAGHGHWTDVLFGWVIPALGDSQMVHSLHHLGMWVIVIFLIVHLYMVIRQDVTTRESIISTMVSGYRTFKD